jgi:hypothetical protein
LKLEINDIAEELLRTLIWFRVEVIPNLWMIEVEAQLIGMTRGIDRLQYNVLPG